MNSDVSPEPWAAFEASAARFMRRIGFADAYTTPNGSDGGVDIRANSAIAQVKARMSATTRPEIQQLAGVALHENKLAIFFSIAGFTSSARQWADSAGVALFTLDATGAARPIGESALRLMDGNVDKSRHSPREAYELPAQIRMFSKKLTAAAAGASTVRDILFCCETGKASDVLALARLAATRLGRSLTGFRSTDIKRRGDLAAILTSLSPDSIVFITHVERLSIDCREALRLAINSRILRIEVSQEPDSRWVDIDLPPHPIFVSTEEYEFLERSFQLAFTPQVGGLNLTVQVPRLSSNDLQAIAEEAASNSST